VRQLKVEGWFSTNILGNNDGRVLDDPESNKTKVASKLSVLDEILGYEVTDHQVHINYYRPRGDEKEAWDNIDVLGFLGERMQIKINFLCKDSILAAPLVLDLVRLMDVAQRCGERGIQRSSRSSSRPLPPGRRARGERPVQAERAPPRSGWRRWPAPPFAPRSSVHRLAIQGGTRSFRRSRTCAGRCSARRSGARSWSAGPGRALRTARPRGPGPGARVRRPSSARGSAWPPTAAPRRCTSR
jgi:hypothetical protein